MCKIKRKTVDIKLQQTFILNCLFIACDVCLSCVHVIYIYKKNHVKVQNYVLL